MCQGPASRCPTTIGRERELTFSNPGPRNVPGFCEGCEAKRREISVQKRAADTKDKTIARQAKRIRTLQREKRELEHYSRSTEKETKG